MSQYDGLAHKLWYAGWRGLCQIVAIGAFGIRCFGRQNVPAQGGALLASNHQSFLDPMVVGLVLSREVHYMARDSLFRQPAFGWLIHSVNAFPVKRHTTDLGAVKESLRRLKAHQLLLLFGEGTRSHDGRIAPLQPGLVMIARKAKVPLIPIVVDGTFEAWPRSSKLCRLCTIRVMFGKPITVQQIAASPDKATSEIIYQRQKEMQNLLRTRYGRMPHSYPSLESSL